MKASSWTFLICAGVAGWLSAAESPSDPPVPQSPPADAVSPAGEPPRGEEPQAPKQRTDDGPALATEPNQGDAPPPADEPAEAQADAPNPAPDQPAATTKPLGAGERSQAQTQSGTSAAGSATTAAESDEPAALVPPGEKGLRLNFRGVPLEMVLNYLSEAAGFIIIAETDIKGKVDVWSNQPLTRDEAVNVLNTVLNKNGYAVIRNERTLKIVSKDSAKTQDLPVISGNDPKGIPKTDEMVTQIIPVRFVSAVQLSRDLQPLMPPQATVVANEGGNAIVITDTQINIRRMTEIIKALDTAVASVSAVRVFPLKNADAKSIATMLRDLFLQDSASQRGNAGNNPMQQFFRGGGRGGNMPNPFGGMAGAGQSGGSGSGRVATAKVVAVADERSNSVIVSAPDDQMTLIEEVINKVDDSVEDITELRVFRLKFSDPQETADLLTSLFPDTTTTQASRTQFRFGGGQFGGGFAGTRGSIGTTGDSSRQQQRSRVLAVPDMRTSSVVVSASRDLLDQIAKMIEQLDADPAKKQKVFVYSVENTDPQAVEEILRGLFEGQNSRYGTQNSRSTTRQSGSQLNNRATQQNQNSRVGGGTSSFGGSGATSRFGGQ
jgi:type II secretory pathway component GspD/PulD (secretin)